MSSFYVKCVIFTNKFETHYKKKKNQQTETRVMISNQILLKQTDDDGLFIL